MLSDCQNLNQLTGNRGRRERYGGKRFTATFNADVILRMRTELYVCSLAQGRTLFWQITPFVLIVPP